MIDGIKETKPNLFGPEHCEKFAQDILDAAESLAIIADRINTGARFINAIREEREAYAITVIQGKDVVKALKEIAMHMDRAAYIKFQNRHPEYND